MHLGKKHQDIKIVPLKIQWMPIINMHHEKTVVFGLQLGDVGKLGDGLYTFPEPKNFSDIDVDISHLVLIAQILYQNV